MEADIPRGCGTVCNTPPVTMLPGIEVVVMATLVGPSWPEDPGPTTGVDTCVGGKDEGALVLPKAALLGGKLEKLVKLVKLD